MLTAKGGNFDEEGILIIDDGILAYWHDGILMRKEY